MVDTFFRANVARRWFPALLATLLVLSSIPANIAFAAPGLGAHIPTVETGVPSSPAPTTVGRALCFEQNDGQFDPRVRFGVRGETAAVLGKDELFLSVAGTASQSPLGLHFLNAAMAEAVGEQEQSATASSFLGNDPSRWKSGIRRYERVRYREIYPGIDMVVYGNDGQIEYDFVVAPGADPRRIQIGVSNADRVWADTDGNLRIRTNGEEIVQRRPTAYQVDGRRIGASYRLNGDGSVGFDVPAYDATRPLVIDPVIDTVARIGGSMTDYTRDVAVDRAGNVYVLGVVSSLDYPVGDRPLESGFRGSTDMTIVKLDPTLQQVVYTAFIGGSREDDPRALAIDNSGRVFVCGSTLSTDFPTVNAVQTAIANFQYQDAVLATLSPDGAALVQATYLGGSNYDMGLDLAIDLEGNPVVVGNTSSTNFPVENAIDDTYNGYGDVFVARIAAEGGTLLSSTYLGGSQSEGGESVVIDAQGNIAVGGRTDSIDYPIRHPVQANPHGNGDLFVTELSPTGSAIVFSTLYGGSDAEAITSMALDDAGNLYCAGYTYSLDFPLVGPSHGQLAGATDGFVLKLFPGGNGVGFSTAISGSATDIVWGLASMPGGWVVGVGYTKSADLQTVNAIQPTFGGESDGFVVRVNAQTGAPDSLSYLGGSTYDQLLGVATDPTGGVYVAGSTWSVDYPGSGQTHGPGGMVDITVARLFFDDGGARVAPQALQASPLAGARIALSWTDVDAGESGFKVERQRLGGALWEQIALLPSNTVSMVDSDLDAGTTYVYRVRTTSGSVDSAFSNEAQAETFAETNTPAPPSRLLARRLSGERNALGWIDNSTNEDGFEIERRPSGSQTWASIALTPHNTTVYVDTPPDPQETYVYRVRSLNGSGSSLPSNEAKVDLPGIPATPDNCRIIPESDSPGIRVNWDPVGTNEEWFTVERKIGAVGNWYALSRLDAQTNTYFDLQIQGGIEYFYRVRAGNAQGESAPSNEVSTTRPIPETPTNLQMIFGSSRNGDLTWDYPFGFFGYFVIEQREGLDGTFQIVTTLSGGRVAHFPNLNPDTIYTFRVRAVEGGTYSGITSLPAELTVQPSQPQPPGAVITVQSAEDSNVRDSQITLREAILIANGTVSVGELTAQEQALVAGVPAVGYDEIHFALTGSGVHTITLTSALPDLTEPVGIDATTQPGYTTAPLVELSGMQAGANVSGLRILAGLSSVRGLAITGFDGSGVEILGGERVTVRRCFVGLAPDGTTVRANGGQGVRIVGVRDVTVSDSVLSGNLGAGVEVSESPSGQSSAIFLSGNRIGTNAEGTTAAGNSIGVRLADVYDVQIGDLTEGGGNLISGNVLDGISVESAVVVRVFNNMIGLNALGDAALANGGYGVKLASSFMGYIGYTSPHSGNVISGNALGGVFVGSLGQNVVVFGNYIGTNRSGTGAIPNGGDGVRGDRTLGLFIGSIQPGSGNLISGNAGSGIRITPQDGSFFGIHHNHIGTDISGTLPLGQGGDGIRIDGESGVGAIGGLSAETANTIAFNAGAGVAIVDQTAHVGVQWNSIHSNGGLGIDLGSSGLNENDPGDADSGPNDLQNSPNLDSAVVDRTLVVTGSLDAKPSISYRIQIYLSPSVNAAGLSEGKVFVGSVDVTTNDAGHADFTGSFPMELAGLQFVTSIASPDGGDSTRDSSEFSRPVPVLHANALPGSDSIGVYQSSSGGWFVRNQNSSGDADLIVVYGPSGAAFTPLTGDWNGDGVDSIGLYDPSTGAFFLRDSTSPGPANLVFFFGAGGQGYVPLVGDWNGDGVDTIGLYNPSSGAFFLKNTNAGGAADETFFFGAGGQGYVPLAGDWNGDGVDTIGLFNAQAAVFFLRNTNTGGAADATIFFGVGGLGYVPLSGDWNGNGVDSIGLYAPWQGAFFLKNVNANGSADVVFFYGAPGLAPLTGDWNGL